MGLEGEIWGLGEGGKIGVLGEIWGFWGEIWVVSGRFGSWGYENLGPGGGFGSG